MRRDEGRDQRRDEGRRVLRTKTGFFLYINQSRFGRGLFGEFWKNLEKEAPDHRWRRLVDAANSRFHTDFEKSGSFSKQTPPKTALVYVEARKTSMHDKAADIPIDQITEPRTILRLVDRDSVEYLEMRDSIVAEGFWNSISVRPAHEPEKYEIIDGLYRYTCARELGLRSIPCIVKHNVSDEAVLAAQIQANAIRPETKPAEFARQMKRMLTQRPKMTFDELAHLIHKSPSWVRQTLGLLKLVKAARRMVDRGEIPVRSAYMLAKIPQRFQEEYLDQARTLPSREFLVLAASVIKRFTEAVKQGKMEAFWCSAFRPQAHLRSLSDIQTEVERQESGALLVTAERCQTPVDGFYAALRWAMHLDRRSIEDQERAARARSRQPLPEESEVRHVTD